jgi:hypothetical protein
MPRRRTDCHGCRRSRRFCHSHRRRCLHRRWCPHHRSGLAGWIPPRKKPPTTTKSHRLMRRRSRHHHRCHRRLSFTSLMSSWTPLPPLLLGDHRHTSFVLIGSHCVMGYEKCRHSDLYRVISVHSNTARHFIFKRA